MLFSRVLLHTFDLFDQTQMRPEEKNNSDTLSRKVEQIIGKSLMLLNAFVVFLKAVVAVTFEPK